MQIDQLVSQQLLTQTLTTADYTPLPVLGIPGWWKDQNPGFYADQSVFRPPRQKISGQILTAYFDRLLFVAVFRNRLTLKR